MATIMATATDSTAASFSAEEALLDAYDLQWKAIDIRLEKLRNECERMILEYEVEVKQKMYLRECEDLVRQQAAEHEAQSALLQRELQAKDREMADARAETKTINHPQQRKKASEPHEEVEKVVVVVKKKAEKRKPVEEKPASTEEESVEEEEEVPKPQLKAKKQTKKKEKAVEKKSKKPEDEKKAQSKTTKAITSEKPVERPLSPPVFSPEEEAEQQVEEQHDEPPVEKTGAANEDLLDMLTQEPEYESEDFGDASSLSLIHPQSPAVESPQRPKEPTQPTPASPVRQKKPTPPAVASPMRSGVMSLTDRIRNRIQAIAKEPLDAQSDSSISPSPIEATPPPKRALKRRKTAVLGPANASSAASAQTSVTANTKDSEKEREAVKGATEAADGVAKKKNTGAKKMDDGKPAVPRKLKKTALDAQDQPEEELSPEQVDEERSDEQEAAPAPKTKIASITGRSKARQTAKLAALRAAADGDAFPMTGFSGINEIKTPKVPRVKLGMDGKKKQISDLASKRAEFKQIMSESIRDDGDEQPAAADEEPEVLAGKKRRRQDVAEKKQAETEEADEGYALKTPKPKKKAKINKNKFANDELNIMKSPVPLLRAKIAEKKKREEEEAEVNNKKNKRTVSEREGADEEEPGYGSQAAAVPASTTAASITAQPAAPVTSTAMPSEEAKQAALDYANRWLNSGLVTRAKKNAVKAAKKPTTKAPKPASMWGSGPSFFDAFVNTAAPAIPRLKTASLLPKE